MSTSMRGIVYAIIMGDTAIVLKVSLSDLTPADITWFRFVMAFASFRHIIITESRLTCGF